MLESHSASRNADIIALAVRLHRRQRLDEAEELYRRVLKTTPDHVDALHFLGVVYHQRGETQKAVDLIQSALQLDPHYVDARINLGNVLKEQGQFDEAESEYRKVVEADAGNADALNNLGAVLKLQKKLSEAIATFEQAIKLSPDHADAHHNLGNALKSADRLEDALTAYRRAIEIDPGHSDAHLNLGRALYRFGRVDEAATVFQKWLEVDPTNPIAEHMFAACNGHHTPERCSDEFVKQSFDAFAGSFDDVLQRLDYRVPKLIQTALEAELPKPDRQFEVLDAGCGTGLCGQHLRPYANRLVGIDLAPKMIEKARGLGLYDQLVVSELTGHMRQQAERYDVIIAADTLVYFGLLSPVFDAAAGALRPNGVFVFTLERAEDEMSGMGYRLNPHGRYSQTQEFVVAALEEAGLTARHIQRDILRLEVHQPVDGLVVTACKEPLYGPHRH